MKCKKLLLAVTILTLFLLNSCTPFSSMLAPITTIGGTTAQVTGSTPDFTAPDTTSVTLRGEETAAAPAPSVTAAQTMNDETTAVPETEPREITHAPETEPREITHAPETEPPKTTLAPEEKPEPDYGAYTKKQIISTYAAALQKTRSLTDSLSVRHSEKIDTKAVDIHPGGALAARLVNYVVGLIGKGGDEVLSFSEGRATNKDGENIPLLLPQRGQFSLPENGVASADAEKSGDLLHIKLTLVPEKVSMGEVPKYNAGAIGYLDTSKMDFSFLKIKRVDINYPGSIIDAYIGSDGCITSAEYTINMKTYAEVSGFGLSGSGTLKGSQSEKWAINR